jgi:NAD(P)H-hydrate epimerase
MFSPQPVRVASAAEAAALDAATIASGVPSGALMRVAGTQAAAIIAARYGDRLGNGVTVYTGSGNNGGDGWVVAAALARAGVPVSVSEVADAHSLDAVAERTVALGLVALNDSPGGGIVIDALLGTGATGAPRGVIAEAVAKINARRAHGDIIVALDLPTGVDATTGVHAPCVRADLTITFGTCKRGHLLARDACGTIAVVDIGLSPDAGTALPVLADHDWVAEQIPAIAFDAHKGTRKKLAIIAGDVGMGGAGILAAQAALRSGIGMVKVATHPFNVSAFQSRIPEVLAETLPLGDDALHGLAQWADAMVIGPGLETATETREVIERVLSVFGGPVLLDAGALSTYNGELDALATLLRGRLTVLTPHPLEFGRLAGHHIDVVLSRRFDIGVEVAARLGATVLLKGAPTVVTTPDGTRSVIASGTAALGTAGSGDTLSGIVATLLAQTSDPYLAATCGAWVHGEAAARCDSVRGVTLDDVMAHLPNVWRTLTHASTRVRYPILAELRSTGDVA